MAAEVPEIRAARRGAGRTTGAVTRSGRRGERRWRVSYYAGSATGARPREIAQVHVSDRSGRVLEAWTGFRVSWTMARGYPGAFGGPASAWWLWLPLAVLFLLPFARPPFGWLHVDLLALVFLLVSFAFFTNGRVEQSVPLSQPPLIYLAMRMLWIARSRFRRAKTVAVDPLRLALSVKALGVGVVVLLVARTALNLWTSNVIDVGYSGVIGADRLTSGTGIYGTFPPDNAHGDTYGPVTYYAYVPWELLLPWSGTWDELPAAHAAAIFFDFLAVAALWALGRAVRGAWLGVLLAYMWCSFPLTFLVLNTNANDALVCAVVAVLLLSVGRPWTCGAVTAAAALTKFAPLILAPLAWTHAGGLRLGGGNDLDSCAHVTWRPGRAQLSFAAATLGATAALLAPVAVIGGLGPFAERTLAFQAARDSPFSIWGLYDLPPALQTGTQVAVLFLAVAVAWFPRRRDTVVVSALAAAVLIAAQLGLSHWFYTYVTWFLPPLWLALLSRHELVRRPKGEDDRRPTNPPRTSGQSTDDRRPTRGVTIKSRYTATNRHTP